MLSLQEVLDYLGYEEESVDEPIKRRLGHLIVVADRFLEGSLGEEYPKEDERVIELALIVIQDLFDNHDMNEKVSGNVRRLVSDFSLQLRLEMRRYITQSR